MGRKSKASKEGLELLNNKEWLSKRLESGATTVALAEETGASHGYVSKCIYQFQLREPGGRMDPETRAFLLDRANLEDLYVAQNRTTKDIGREFGVSETTIRHFMYYHGMEIRVGTHHYSGSQLQILDPLKIKELVERGLSNIEIGKIVGLSSGAVCRHRNKYGLPAYDGLDEVGREILKNPEEIVRLYEEGFSAQAIGDRFGIGAHRVYRVLSSQGVQMRSRLKVANGETEIVEFLRDAGVENIERNVKPFGSNMELDIYLPDYKLGIEHNGIYWHTDKYKKKPLHLNKFKFFEENGVQLLQFWEDQWIEQQEIVKSLILSKLGLLNWKKINARECQIRSLTTEEYRDFLDEYHIQGYVVTGARLGLFYDNELVSCIGAKNRGNGEWEILRFASSANVRGGFSKLLSAFEKQMQPKTIITFADRMISDGSLYHATGFEVDKVLPIDYQYFYNNGRHHKFRFRKKRFKEDPELFFDPTFTERQLADANRVYRLWDAGKLRFRKTCVSTEKDV